MRVIFDDLETETDIEKYVEETLQTIFGFFTAVILLALIMYKLYQYAS